jgi:hypothetical protein
MDVERGDNMKKLFFLAVFILTSCSAPQPQATVTSAQRVTVTLPPPTATVIPTPTLPPAFLAIQEQVAGDTQNYAIMGNGNIEGKLPDGTIGPLPGIRLNEDGTSYTITVNGAPVTIDASQVTITDENGLQVEGLEDPDGDGNYEKIVKSQAETWAEANNAGFDKVNGVAWDKTTGLVIWAQDAKGEWINYPNGNVPIPPGPGYENEPPLMVPYYHSFNEAMTAVTNELPWGEIPNVYREKQNNEASRISDVYWLPQFTVNGGTWTNLFAQLDNIHVTSDPKISANVGLQGIQLVEGNRKMNLSYNSSATNYFFKRIFIFGDPQEIYVELQRIDECVKNNAKADNLAELCASPTITIPAPTQ